MDDQKRAILGYPSLDTTILYQAPQLLRSLYSSSDYEEPDNYLWFFEGSINSINTNGGIHIDLYSDNWLLVDIDLKYNGGQTYEILSATITDRIWDEVRCLKIK